MQSGVYCVFSSPSMATTRTPRDLSSNQLFDRLSTSWINWSLGKLKKKQKPSNSSVNRWISSVLEGLLFMLQGSWLLARRSWLMAKKGARGRRHWTWAPAPFLAMSHESWAISYDPWTMHLNHGESSMKHQHYIFTPERGKCFRGSPFWKKCHGRYKIDTPMWLYGYVAKFRNFETSKVLELKMQ